MSTPLLEKKKYTEGAWFPDGWEESSQPCEIKFGPRFGGLPDCPNPAEVALRLHCGCLKLVCGVHLEHLTSPWGITEDAPFACLKCKSVWTSFAAMVVRYWRI